VDGTDGLALSVGRCILAFVNSMGGTCFELYIVYRKLAEICQEQGLQIVRNLVGPISLPGNAGC